MINDIKMTIQLNEKAEIITGYKEVEVIGKNWFDIFIKNEDHLEIMKVFKDLINGHIYEWEHTNIINCKNEDKNILWSNNIIVSDKNTILESIGQVVE